MNRECGQRVRAGSERDKGVEQARSLSGVGDGVFSVFRVFSGQDDTQIDLPPFKIAMWKPGEMEALMRPNPYSSSTIDMCGKRGFGTLFSDFLRFFGIFYRAGRTGALLAGIKGKEKAFAVIRKRLPKWLQMPSVMELVGHGTRKSDEENTGATDGAFGE